MVREEPLIKQLARSRALRPRDQSVSPIRVPRLEAKMSMAPALRSNSQPPPKTRMMGSEAFQPSFNQPFASARMVYNQQGFNQALSVSQPDLTRIGNTPPTVTSPTMATGSRCSSWSTLPPIDSPVPPVLSPLNTSQPNSPMSASYTNLNQLLFVQGCYVRPSDGALFPPPVSNSDIYAVPHDVYHGSGRGSLAGSPVNLPDSRRSSIIPDPGFQTIAEEPLVHGPDLYGALVRRGSLQQPQANQNMYQQRGSLPTLFYSPLAVPVPNQDVETNMNDEVNNNYEQKVDNQHIQQQPSSQTKPTSIQNECLSPSCTCFSSLCCKMCNLFGQQRPPMDDNMAHQMQMFAMSTNLSNRQSSTSVFVARSSTLDQNCSTDNAVQQFPTNPTKPRYNVGQKMAAFRGKSFFQLLSIRQTKVVSFFVNLLFPR